MERLSIKVRIYSGEEIALGPGKADLLEAIVAHGSIASAARSMRMSYRRAWLLVDAMNRCWSAPLVATSPAGAHLTELGERVLVRYRALTTAAEAAASGDWSALAVDLRPSPSVDRAAEMPKDRATIPETRS